MERLNLSITDKAKERIEKLLADDDLAFTSKSDVFRTALALLEIAVEESKKR